MSNYLHKSLSSHVMILFYITATFFISFETLNAQNPGFAKEPTITEYDVDPLWPQIPESISKKGWVSGLAIDDKDQIWFFKKGRDPVQVYTVGGKFVRSWGRDKFINPHQLRIGPDGNIWVADFGLHVVQKFTPTGELLLTLGVRGEKGGRRIAL